MTKQYLLGALHDATVRKMTYRIGAKDCKKDLLQLMNYLMELGIQCGQIHNPSNYKDPHYWRFYIGAKSYEKFAQVIGSLHPVKSKYLRVKI